MKLSKREIALIADLQKSRRRRKTTAWVFLIFMAIWWFGMPLLGISSETVHLMTGLLLGLGIANLISVYYGVQPDDKLIDLLQRYINDDAEALHQLSRTSEVRGSIA